MKKIFLLIAVLVAAGCQPINNRGENVLVAVGYASISDQRGRNAEEKQVRALRASKVDAYRELAEQVYGLRVSARSDLEDQRLGAEYASGAVDGVIRGAEVVRTYAVGDNYITELKLDIEKMDKLREYGDVQQVPIKKKSSLF
ncbi:flagellar biosynthesis protein FlgP [Vibrio sp. S9_S30]|uniref:LPP20 family lipoprotein n=1 Tax=Vibrio sp. S9_S30 TaxID=2720226 RepID=UPI001680B7F4|nr:LPP20 family lipoprotein [Vibrio sp. S9_S30]MBD1559548.1 flagellar biosynthesis protein FlgP [Vibrio sp. S9_S30]